VSRDRRDAGHDEVRHRECFHDRGKPFVLGLRAGVGQIARNDGECRSLRESDDRRDGVAQIALGIVTHVGVAAGDDVRVGELRDEHGTSVNKKTRPSPATSFDDNVIKRNEGCLLLALPRRLLFRGHFLLSCHVDLTPYHIRIRPVT